MGGNEQLYVQEAFAGNWIAPVGENLNKFEQAIVEATACGHAAAITSGTAGLHLALILSGVGPGDYVLCQSLTFCASANPIRYLGAIPVFIGSEPNSWNMCPKALEEAIQACMTGEIQQFAQADCPDYAQLTAKKPKVILPVHLYGMPADMDQILAVAKRYEIPVVEDAAEALGASYKGQACGTFGDFGIYSFNGNKIITTSGGGAIVSQDAAKIAHARHLATQARDPAPHYQHTEIGYNYRLSNVSAGIGRGQMEVLPEWVNRRRRNHAFYKEALGQLPGIEFLEEQPDTYANHWLTCILLDPASSGGVDRETIRLHLDAQNIESRPIWKPMHQQPVFASFPYVGDETADRVFERGLCLPSGSSMEKEDLERVVEQIIACFQAVSEKML
ncbi:degt/dnrj/eryc1/strs aminotransferase [Nitritalea halalkaliphila LW7]|uniref:Degt/dnrj/eryc1/strs aminotransferase n=2 Tax=Nitritalea TaxID=1187887 RepID=I5C994_9BACT|nr:degt/dnrj/eryc1/strs aminotransferase [Nitritalea halalkaliphila LW7]